MDDAQFIEKQIKQALEAIVRTRRMVVFTGAGFFEDGTISSFGEPIGQWNNLSQPEIASLAAFETDPVKVWRWYQGQRKLLSQTTPTPAHYSLAELENVMEDFLLITQTLDGLHQKAGSKNVVELRGNLWQVRCSKCDYRADTENEALEEEPRCPACGDRLRPSVVWADEAIPEEPFAIALESAGRCDVLLCIGVDTEIQPAASLIWEAKSAGAFLIEIDPRTTAVSGIADIHLNRYPQTVLPAIMNELKALMEAATSQQ